MNPHEHDKMKVVDDGDGGQARLRKVQRGGYLIDQEPKRWKAQYTKKQLTPTKRRAKRKAQTKARKAGRR